MGSNVPSTRSVGYRRVGEDTSRDGGYGLNESCGADASVERARRSLDFFGRDGSQSTVSRGDRGGTSERGRNLRRYSRKEYDDLDDNSVRGDDRDGIIGGSRSFDGNRRICIGEDNRVDHYGRDRREEGRERHSRSSSMRSQRSTSHGREKRGRSVCSSDTGTRKRNQTRSRSPEKNISDDEVSCSQALL